jgi:hypothetical protein
MMPWVVLAAAYARPGNVDRRFPLGTAHHLRPSVLRGNGEEPGHVLSHQVPLFKPTFLRRCHSGESACRRYGGLNTP